MQSQDKYTIEEVAKQFDPEDIFTEEQLIAWARRTHASNIFTLRELRQGIDDLNEERYVPDY